MAPKRLPARTVDLSQEHKYLPPPKPTPVRSQILALIRTLARESGFVLLVLVLFILSLSVSHALHRWGQAPAAGDSPQRIVWSTVFERKARQQQPVAAPAPLSAQAPPATVRPAAGQQIIIQKAQPSRARPAPRRLTSSRITRTGQQQRQRPQTSSRTVSPAAQPIQQILHKDYGTRADKPYSHYMHWVDTTLADYQRQQP